MATACESWSVAGQRPSCGRRSSCFQSLEYNSVGAVDGMTYDISNAYACLTSTTQLRGAAVIGEAATDP